ncbi:MAG: hypothetical protein WCK77_13305 [Verrucomicrobiota bacterium]
MNTTTPRESNAIEQSVNHWGITIGTAPDNVLAMAASILTGLAGPGATFRLPWGCIPLDGLNLLVQEGQGGTTRALDMLLSPVRQANLLVLQTMGGVNRKMLDFQQAGTFASNPAKVNPGGPNESTALLTLQKTIKPESGSHESPAAADLVPDPGILRLEAMRRPAILLEGVRFTDLKNRLLGCHRLSALAILRLTPTLEDPDKKKLLTALTEILDGCEVAIPPDKTHGIEPHHPARLSAIVRLDSKAWDGIHEEAPQLLERGLLLAQDNMQVMHAPKVEGATAYGEFYRGAVEEVAITRRDGQFLQVGFDDPAAAASFQESLNSYTRTCHGLAHEVGAAARNLPVALAWSMLVLSRQMTGEYAAHRPADAQIVTTSFQAANRLLARHHATMGQMEMAASRESMLAIAGRLVFKVRGKGPVSERQLVRSFTQQKLSIYRPVIDALVNGQVLELTPEGLLQTGPRPFEDAQSDLWVPTAMVV